MKKTKNYLKFKDCECFYFPLKFFGTTVKIGEHG